MPSIKWDLSRKRRLGLDERRGAVAATNTGRVPVGYLKALL